MITTTTKANFDITYSETATDRRLVARFNGGDSSAFDEIVSRYRGKILAMANRLIRNPEDAEEITQDCFIRAHAALGRFRGDSSLSTWLHHIATNLARNRYWYWWRRKRHVSQSFDQPIGTEGDRTLADLVPSQEGGPNDEVGFREYSEHIARCIENLSSDNRLILNLRCVQDKSYDEIATLLGIKIGTVKSRICRAREALREVLLVTPGLPPTDADSCAAT